MKNTFLLLITTLLISSCSIERSGMRTGGGLLSLPSKSRQHINQEDMELLRNRNIVFFFKENDTESRADIEKAIKEIWTFTPIEFAYYSERSNYPPDLYAYFTIEGTLVIGNNSFNSYYYLTLTVKNPSENYKRDKAIYFGKQYIMTQSIIPKRGEEAHSLIEAIYTYNEIPNWNATILQAYLLDIQGDLEENKRELEYDKVFNEEHLDALKEDTLFIPEYALERRLLTTGKKHDPKELLKTYPYSYKIISTEDLNKRIFANKETYIFDYVVASQKKFIRIYNTKAGKIYQNYSPLFAFGLNSNDFRHIYR